MKNTYSEMKDSGVEWLGMIPKHWKLIANKYVMKKQKTICQHWQGENILSLTKVGVIIRDINNPFGKMPETFDGYQYVQSGNLLMCLFDIDVTPRCVGRVLNNGVTSPAYSNFKLAENASLDYYYYYYLMLDNEKTLLHLAKNLRHSFTEEHLAQLKVPFPPLPEQTAIAAYLDDKCGAIDEIIEQAKASIEEYKAWKSSVIFEAVTKGLNPNAEMKDSGVDIIGFMPKHWNLCRQRFLCKTTTGDHDTQDAEPEGEFPFYVRSPNVERSNTYTFDGEGVLMAGDGAGAGRVFHYATGKYAIHQRVYCFYDFNGISPRFYHYFMENLFSIEMDKGSAKSTVPSVRLPMLKDFEICLPSLTEQETIVKALDEKCATIDGIIADKEALIADMEAYKKSLIFETVTGKRKVC